MAYVSVPKDLTKVKSKVMFNLTKRQVVCLGIAAALGLQEKNPAARYRNEHVTLCELVKANDRTTDD